MDVILVSSICFALPSVLCENLGSVMCIGGCNGWQLRLAWLPGPVSCVSTVCTLTLERMSPASPTVFVGNDPAVTVSKGWWYTAETLYHKTNSLQV